MASYGTSNSAYGNWSNNRSSTIQKSTNKIPKGLDNLTNTCYISACLQILFQLIPDTLKSGSITKLFFKLKNSHDKYDYKQFKRQIQKKIEIVQGWDQQDAGEFLIGFLEVLNQQNTKQLKQGNYYNGYNQKQNVENNWKKFKNQSQTIENSQIINLFYGQLIRQLQCPKGHLKHVFQRYLQLSISFSESTQKSSLSYYSYNSSSIKLTDLIKKQFQGEIVDQLDCQQCKKKQRFKKYTFLYTLPKYLIIQLSRFKKGYYSQEKVASVVDYDQYISLTEQKTKQNINYKLVGVVNHYGTLNRGHYFANVKVNNQWYEINDQDVSTCKISTRNNESKYVYILFYEKVNK